MLGSEKKRRATLAGLESAHGVLQARIDRELSLRRTPTLTFAYDDVGRARRPHDEADRRACGDLPRRREEADDERRPDLEAVADGAPRARPLPRRRRTRTPTATRSARCSRRRSGCARSARTRHVPRGHARRCRPSTGSSTLDERARATLPADLGERVLLAVDCANERRIGEDRAGRRRRAARGRRRPPPRQHALRRRQPDRRRRLVDGRDRPRPAARARRRADARDRRGALRRARHRHRPLPVLEHDAEGAPARGRARRGRRRRARRLPARLRDGAVREAEAARARARARAALRGRPARRLVPAAGRLRRGRRRGAVLGGDHRLPARRSRARRWSR